MEQSRSTTSGWVTAGALVGMAATNLLANLAIGNELNTILIVFALVLVGLAALTITRRWWAYALAALVAALMFLQTLIGATDTLTNTSDPAFLGAVAFLIFALVATVAGASSALKARRVKTMV
jgi:Flp pilus assembly protein protease CpaA